MRNQAITPLADPISTNLIELEFETFEARIQALPQELQDTIFEQVVALPSSNDNIVHITSTYKPPLALQVNKKLRNDLARTYYTDSTFQVSHKENLNVGKKHYNERTSWDILCFYWLEQLNSAHRHLINKIRLEVNVPERTRHSKYHRHFDGDMARQGLPTYALWGGDPQSHAEFNARTVLHLFAESSNASSRHGLVLSPILMLRLVCPEMGLGKGVWYRCSNQRKGEGGVDVVVRRELMFDAGATRQHVAVAW